MNRGSTVAVVRTGVANLASVLAGLRRAGACPVVTQDPQMVAEAPRLVLPGVGSFGAAMERLEANGLTKPLAARIRAGRPTLAICLGMQLLASASEENPDVAGLGVLNTRVTRLRAPRTPQLGWNRVEPGLDCILLRGGFAYFAHSYCLRHPPPGWRVAFVQFGERVVAALERDEILACQFHPE
ncbi:MAG: imidazole glycerol phosphate synthase subunit HisH, partial [Planctomycetota bacterium]